MRAACRWAWSAPLIVVTDAAHEAEVLDDVNTAAQEHPLRALVVVAPSRSPKSQHKKQDAKSRGGVDAQVRVGEGVYGEAVIVRVTGEVAQHAASVISPLLLPDSPVAIWWPDAAPVSPADDPLGALATRRITDAAANTRRGSAFIDRAGNYEPGDTDFAWTRLTPWRALLAAALDQYPTTIDTVHVSAARGNDSADLLTVWLRSRLRAKAVRHKSGGPGITEVRMLAKTGEIAVKRTDGRVGRFRIPAQPDRSVALNRRSRAALLSEELRRLDPDDLYAETLRAWLVSEGRSDAAKAVARKCAEQRAAHEGDYETPGMRATDAGELLSDHGEAPEDADQVLASRQSPAVTSAGTSAGTSAAASGGGPVASTKRADKPKGVRVIKATPPSKAASSKSTSTKAASSKAASAKGSKRSSGKAKRG